jgi:ELWxxDGT repeat protein
MRVSFLGRCKGRKSVCQRQEKHRARRWLIEQLESRQCLAVTSLVSDIDKEPVSSNDGSDFVHVGDHVYFTRGNAEFGVELWKTDGTNAGTELVKDIRPGTNGSDIRSLTNVNGILYFSANDGTTGRRGANSGNQMARR